METFVEKENCSFECPYGWAWLLTLGAELSGISKPQARAWQTAIDPLAEMLAVSIGDYFDRLTFPCAQRRSFEQRIFHGACARRASHPRKPGSG